MEKAKTFMSCRRTRIESRRMQYTENDSTFKIHLLILNHRAYWSLFCNKFEYYLGSRLEPWKCLHMKLYANRWKGALIGCLAPRDLRRNNVPLQFIGSCSGVHCTSAKSSAFAQGKNNYSFCLCRMWSEALCLGSRKFII